MTMFLNRFGMKFKGFLTAIIEWVLLRLEVKDMAIVYATLIIKGRKTFEDVPNALKEQVRQILIDLDLPELAE